MKLPFFAKYPYTNLEQLNIDWLLEKIGGFDERIRSNTERITLVEGRCDVIETRLDGHDEDISDLKRRMDTAEGDIDALEGRMDTAEGDIDALEGRMDTAEGDIDALERRMDTAEGDIVIINGKVLSLETDVENIIKLIARPYDDTLTYYANYYCTFKVHGTTKMYRATATTTGTFKPGDWQETNVEVELERLTARGDNLDVAMEQLTLLVNSFNNVVANPGGSGTTLNTIKIGNNIYEVPSGGGSGSSVTPNPSGVATDTLNTVDIDGTIYAMPETVEANPLSSGTEDLTKLKVGTTTYDVQHLTVDSALDDTSGNPIANDAVTTAINTINNTISSLGTVVNGIDSGSQYLSYPGFNEVGKVDITPGTWLIVSNYGLSPIAGATLQNVHTQFMACTDKTDIDHTSLPVDDEKMFKMNEGVLTYTMTNLLTVAANTTVYFGFIFGNSFGSCGKKNNGIIAIRLK